MFSTAQKQLQRLALDLRLFGTVISLVGFSESVVGSVFNNYLNETFGLSSLQRTLLELPRELPGLLVVFVSALLFFLSSRRLAVLANFLTGLGLVLLAFFSPVLPVMLIWLFLFSMGVHLFLPLSFSIGMELAGEDAAGRRLGQLNSIRNLATVIGSFVVSLGFKFFHWSFTFSFLLAAAGYFTAAILLRGMTASNVPSPGVYLKWYPEFRLYYWLTVLYGTRKQIFLTLGPWVLVKIFGQPTQTVAMLLTVGGAAGIVFQPLLGRLVDTLGERKILASEAVVLVFVCLGYGFARTLFAPKTAFLVAAGCYVADQLLMSVSMARATYLKKIAPSPDQIAPALSMGTTIDHFFSAGIALLAGVIWTRWGYQYVFLCGAGIAVVNFFSTLRIRIPKTAELARAAGAGLLETRD